jgi:hypothetical protein
MFFHVNRGCDLGTSLPGMEKEYEILNFEDQNCLQDTLIDISSNIQVISKAVCTTCLMELQDIRWDKINIGLSEEFKRRLYMYQNVYS